MSGKTRFQNNGKFFVFCDYEIFFYSCQPRKCTVTTQFLHVVNGSLPPVIISLQGIFITYYAYNLTTNEVSGGELNQDAVSLSQLLITR